MGKTLCYDVNRVVIKKHPHVHGEDPIKHPDADGILETPPRAWGRLPAITDLAKGFGNTPTCMGKTPDFRANGRP